MYHSNRSLSGLCFTEPLGRRIQNSLAFTCSRRSLEVPWRKFVRGAYLPEVGGEVERAAM